MWKWVALLALVLGGFWLIDKRGADRARAQERAIVAANTLRLHEIAAQLSGELGTKFETQAANLHADLDNIDRIETTVVKPTLIKEIQSDPRFVDPAAGITDGMRDTLNLARRQSHDPGTQPGAASSLSAPLGIEQQFYWNFGN